MTTEGKEWIEGPSSPVKPREKQASASTSITIKRSILHVGRVSNYYSACCASASFGLPPRRALPNGGSFLPSPLLGSVEEFRSGCC